MKSFPLTCVPQSPSSLLLGNQCYPSWISPRDIVCIHKQMHVCVVHIWMNGYTCTYTPFSLQFCFLYLCFFHLLHLGNWSWLALELPHYLWLHTILWMFFNFTYQLITDGHELFPFFRYCKQGAMSNISTSIYLG